jgi:hypothetical protein
VWAYGCERITTLDNKPSSRIVTTESQSRVFLPVLVGTGSPVGRPLQRKHRENEYKLAKGIFADMNRSFLHAHVTSGNRNLGARRTSVATFKAYSADNHVMSDYNVKATCQPLPITFISITCQSAATAFYSNFKVRATFRAKNTG